MKKRIISLVLIISFIVCSFAIGERTVFGADEGDSLDQIADVLYSDSYDFSELGWKVYRDGYALFFSSEYSRTERSFDWVCHKSCFGDKYKPVAGDIILFYRTTAESPTDHSYSHVSVCCESYDKKTKQYVTFDGNCFNSYGENVVMNLTHRFRRATDTGNREAVIWHCTNDNVREAIIKAVEITRAQYESDPDYYVSMMRKYSGDGWCWVHVINVMINAENFLEGNIQLTIGSRMKLPVTGKNLKFSSSKPGSVRVSQKGYIRAKKPGISVITVTDSEGNVVKTFNVRALYKDVDQGSPYYKSAYWAFDAGIFIGKTLYKPYRNVSRGQFVNYLWRMSGKPAISLEFSPFSDMEVSNKYLSPASWAVLLGIVSRNSKGEFKPDKIINRKTAVTAIWKYDGKPEPVKTDPYFSDLSSGSLFKAAQWAYENGLIEPVDGAFRSGAALTRGETFIMIYNYMLQTSKV